MHQGEDGGIRPNPQRQRQMAVMVKPGVLRNCRSE